MSTKKKIILLIAMISYACIIYGFMAGSGLWMMLAAMVYGVLLLLFTLSANLPDQEELDSLREKCRESEEEVSAAKQQLQELTEAKERKEKALEQALEEAVAARDEAAGEKEEPAVVLSQLLPPVGNAVTETIDIIRIARETVEELKPYAEKAAVEIRISAPEEVILVKAQAERLRILFRNIIDNSIKYMNRAGSLVITISNLGDDIFIVLKDNGNGLSETETEHIFELNYQGSNRISGNGLGLTQAKAIVDYYGGTIYAKSTVGKGMGIYVQLPTD